MLKGGATRNNQRAYRRFEDKQGVISERTMRYDWAYVPAIEPDRARGNSEHKQRVRIELLKALNVLTEGDFDFAIKITNTKAKFYRTCDFNFLKHTKFR